MTRQDLTSIAGHAFIVTDNLGDIFPGNDRGLFVADTRFLSRYVLRLNGKAPLLLRSGQVGHSEASIFATNVATGQEPDHSLELTRRRSIDGSFLEEIRLTNHGPDTARIDVTIAVDADFADVFEVRAIAAERPPRRAAGRTVNRHFVFSDRAPRPKRQSRVRFTPEPESIRRGLARFPVELAPYAAWRLDVRVDWDIAAAESALPVPVHPSALNLPLIDWLQDVPALETDDLHLQAAWDRSIRDLVTLALALSSGHAIPAAGIPWYLAIFGRDALITSFQTLAVAPRLAVGTLRTLAAYQAARASLFRDAEPGKMPHEIRFGALAQSDTVPHSRYYGTVDATPLWVMLLAAVYRWTGDRELVEELLPAAERAMRWIDTFGDRDGDGLIEYQKRSPHGLDNQGWKDSWDSIRFADGRLAEPPIALVEVQGYVYAAKLAMAELYDAIGMEPLAAPLRAEAARLRELVHQAFWMPEAQCYALALDGKKMQVDSVASNQGHLLWTGLVDPHHASMVVERIMAPDSFSGRGVRTLAKSMTGYNPFGYHTGSVWPHDTMLTAAGFRRYGFANEATILIEGLIEASQWFDGHALPELFCGYDRSETPFPVDYPVACSPQAWSAGATVMLVTELAGISAGVGGLNVDPLPHDRALRLSGVPFRGKRLDVDSRQNRGEPAAM